MKLELHFTDSDIEKLCNTQMKGFVSSPEQAGRFEIPSPRPEGLIFSALVHYEEQHGQKNTTLMWVGDNYLHAMIVCAYNRKKHGCDAHILWDTAEGYGGYVVWAARPTEWATEEATS